MKKHYLMSALFGVCSLSAMAFVVDWGSIRYWAGEGDSKAALVVQFSDGKDEKAYVWGYRWNKASGQPSGEDMFRALASDCNDIYLFTQYTGWMGNTVCGIGVSENNSVSSNIEYDFDSAMDDPNISFNWFSANTSLGQTAVPGWDTPEICADAISKAKLTNILEHPIDAGTYGYACYDYDHWKNVTDKAGERWQAGWYNGYWSYWVGGADSESLSYSGVGYTSRKLEDGNVDAWKFTLLKNSSDADAPDGYTGASTPWHELDYVHFGTSGQLITDVAAEEELGVIYRLDGTSIPKEAKPAPGIYIVMKNGEYRKILIR